jgi:hypothetical protein
LGSILRVVRPPSPGDPFGESLLHSLVSFLPQETKRIILLQRSPKIEEYPHRAENFCQAHDFSAGGAQRIGTGIASAFPVTCCPGPKVQSSAGLASELSKNKLFPCWEDLILSLSVLPVPRKPTIPFPNLPPCYSWALAVVLWELELKIEKKNKESVI